METNINQSELFMEVKRLLLNIYSIIDKHPQDFQNLVGIITIAGFIYAVYQYMQSGRQQKQTIELFKTFINNQSKSHELQLKDIEVKTRPSFEIEKGCCRPLSTNKGSDYIFNIGMYNRGGDAINIIIEDIQDGSHWFEISPKKSNIIKDDLLNINMVIKWQEIVNRIGFSEFNNEKYQNAMRGIHSQFKITFQSKIDKKYYQLVTKEPGKISISNPIEI